MGCLMGVRTISGSIVHPYDLPTSGNGPRLHFQGSNPLPLRPERGLHPIIQRLDNGERRETRFIISKGRTILCYSSPPFILLHTRLDIHDLCDSQASEIYVKHKCGHKAIGTTTLLCSLLQHLLPYAVPPAWVATPFHFYIPLFSPIVPVDIVKKAGMLEGNAFIATQLSTQHLLSPGLGTVHLPWHSITDMITVPQKRPVRSFLRPFPEKPRATRSGDHSHHGTHRHLRPNNMRAHTVTMEIPHQTHR